jgi:hypothetical protein
MQMIWAECSTSSDLIIHDDTRKIVLTLKDNGGSDSDVSKTETYVIIAHGFALWFAWMSIGCVMVATNRWFSWISDKS